MYKKLLIVMVLAALVSCSNQNTDNPEDKKKKLEALKKEHAELQTQISALENEVGKDEGPAGKVELIAVTEAKKGVFTHFIEVQGKVDSDQNVTLSARVPGSVTSVKVNRGDKVTKGQVLAQLDDQAVAQGLDEVRNQLSLATTVYQKQKNLWDQKIGTEIQFLTAKNNKEALEKRLATMQEQLEMYRIRAPFSGSVDEVNTRIGETVAPGLPLFRVVNFSKTKILAEVSENYANKVKPGDEVIVKFPDINKEITSKIRVVSQAINVTNRTFTIEIALDPKDMQLRPNLIAIIRIKDYTNKDAIILPLNVVQKDDKNENYLYTVSQEDNGWKAVKRTAVTGTAYNGEVEVLKGLEGGEKVITTGYQNVTDGQRVTITNDQQDTAKKE